MYTVIIKFIDGEILTIEKVVKYELLDDDSAYLIEKNGYRAFFNSKYVKYIGRKFDLTNQGANI